MYKIILIFEMFDALEPILNKNMFLVMLIEAYKGLIMT